MLHGWIKLHRGILDHWCASEPESLAVWIRMLTEANHKESKKRFNGSLITVRRGQLIFGLNAFSDKSGVSISKLRRIISELESDGMISRQITSKYSLITITCFEKYQGIDSQDASKSQADDKQIASESQHRKNVKNNKNVKEDILSPNDDAVSVINHLNSECGTSYKTSTKATLQVIKARLKEGFTVDDLKAVVTDKAKNWKDDPKMSEYLRPATLFQASKFEAYLISAKSEVVKSELSSGQPDWMSGML